MRGNDILGQRDDWPRTTPSVDTSGIRVGAHPSTIKPIKPANGARPVDFRYRKCVLSSILKLCMFSEPPERLQTLCRRVSLGRREDSVLLLDGR